MTAIWGPRCKRRTALSSVLQRISGRAALANGVRRTRVSRLRLQSRPQAESRFTLRIDARVNLPAGRYSYLLEKFTQYFCVEQAFGQAADAIQAVLGQKRSVDTLERTNQRVGEQARDYLDALPSLRRKRKANCWWQPPMARACR